MVKVVGVRFRKTAKIYFFDPSNVWPKVGDMVIVETARGNEMGEIVSEIKEVTEESLVAPLKGIVRMATPGDIRRAKEFADREPEALRRAAKIIEAHRDEIKPEMKPIDCEYSYDGKKVYIYFSAESRVDFRSLLPELRSVLKPAAVELRQISSRDEAKLLGGLGICGREICCHAFINDLQPVTQSIVSTIFFSKKKTNPSKAAGLCGRYMCCLRFEAEAYSEYQSKLPRYGAEVKTPDGIGKMDDVLMFQNKVKVSFGKRKVTDGDGKVHYEDDVREYPVEAVCRANEELPNYVPEEKEADMLVSADYDVPMTEADIPTVNPTEAKENRDHTAKPKGQKPVGRRSFGPQKGNRPHPKYRGEAGTHIAKPPKKPSPDQE